MRKRKLWKITDQTGRQARPESQNKVYRIYLPNWAAEYRFAAAYPESYRDGEAERRRQVVVWVDERDGFGWQRFEDIDLAEFGGAK